jgi:hypothetical protein
VMTVERWPVCQHRGCEVMASRDPVPVLRRDDSGAAFVAEVVWLCAHHRAMQRADRLDLEREIEAVTYAPLDRSRSHVSTGW